MDDDNQDQDAPLEFIDPREPMGGRSSKPAAPRPIPEPEPEPQPEVPPQIKPVPGLKAGPSAFEGSAVDENAKEEESTPEPEGSTEAEEAALATGPGPIAEEPGPEPKGKPAGPVPVEPAPQPVAAKRQRPRLAVPSMPQKFRTRRAVVVAVAILLVVAGAWWWHGTHSLLSDADVIKKVAALTDVPSGETPIVTTVVDKNKTDQLFLANAQNGDKVVVYLHAKKAILYRPSSNRIINIGPVQPPALRVWVRNGTGDNAYTSLDTRINANSDFKVVSHDASPNLGYTTTLVVDLTGKNSSEAARLATTVNGTVSSLPAGESKPDADLLVIVGSGQ